MVPPHHGNVYLPFTDLVKLEKIDERTYRSTAAPFSPGGAVGRGRAYGGHVYMQAAWAACHTVAPGFLLHNVTGSFLLPGLITVPFVYKAEGKGVCFTATCSFKKAETSPTDVQEEVDLWDRYFDVLEGRKPQDFPEVPGMDVPWYWKRRRETGLNDEFPGLEARMVDMESYNVSRHPLDRRQLVFYRGTGDIPRDPNMHLCAHLYASDRNGLFIIAKLADVGDIGSQTGTLTHTVVFHTNMEDVWFQPSASIDSQLDDKDGRWFCRGTGQTDCLLDAACFTGRSGQRLVAISLASSKKA